MSEPCQTSAAPSPRPRPAPRVLLVDGDRGRSAALFTRLEARGFEPDAAPDGPTGLALARAGDHDVLVVDEALARLDGLALLRRLRAEGLQVPVLVTLARDALDARLAAFDAGADDCAGRSIDIAELEARLRALGRRRCPLTTRLRVADLRFDVAAGEITRGTRRLHVFRGGRTLLELLMRASPAIVPKHRLEEALWGDEPPCRDLLRAHVYELRRRIDADGEAPLLHTVPGVGYRLAPQ